MHEVHLPPHDKSHHNEELRYKELHHHQAFPERIAGCAVLLSWPFIIATGLKPETTNAGYNPESSDTPIVSSTRKIQHIIAQQVQFYR